MIPESDLLEQIRQDLELSAEEFCQKLTVALDDYSTFVSADDLSNLPPRAMNKLKELMLDMERANLEKFKNRIPIRPHGHFHSAKILRHFDKLAGLQGDTPQAVGPITVEFHPSNPCNHRCPACTFGIPERTGESPFAKALFDTDLLPALLEDLKELDVRGIDISGGGEPLLHPSLASIIVAFADNGFDVGLVTNGSRLWKDESAEIRKTILRNCTWCRVSVDAGSQAVYEKMHGRGSEISFEKVVEGVKRLAVEKTNMGSETTLGVSFLLTPENFLDLIKSACIFRDVPGVDYFQVKPIVIPPAERVTHPNMIFWDRRLFDALVTLGAYEKRGFAVYTLGFKFIDMLLNETRGLPFTKCWGHPFYPTICADGTVLVCCHMLNSVFEGNQTGVYGRLQPTVRFRDIWKDPRRFTTGKNITIRLCPSNCKLSETNKTLEQMYDPKPVHSNFIG